MTRWLPLLLLLGSPAFAQDSDDSVLSEEVAPSEALAPEADAEEAASEDAPAEAAAVGAPPIDLASTWAALPAEEVLAEAVSRRRVGDFEGSLRRFEHLRERGAGPGVLHEEGITLEYVERFDEALANYEAVLAHPDASGELAVEAAFRRVLVLEDLGRYDDSLAQVKELQGQGDWAPLQEVSLELTRGVNELQGKKAKKGLKRLDKALAQLDAESLPWLQAKARTALARYLLDEAEALVLEGNKKAGKNLVRRSQLMVAAEQQVIAVANLGEPEYILEGLVLMGDAYLSLHDDMLAAPPPRKLDADQRALYEQTVAEKAAVLPAKALRYYDEGVQVAVRTGWQGSVVDELRARRDATASSL